MISVVTATWNCASTVADCIASVQRQSYGSYEHIVVDGCSSDGTVEVLESNRSSLAVLLSEPDHGVYDALNKGIVLAGGDVIGFLHSDDVYASDDVLAQIATAFEDPTVAAVYGDLDYVRKDNLTHVVRRWRGQAFSRKRLERGWMPPHPTLYVRRDWYSRIGGFDARYRISADYFSILTLFANPEFRAVYIPVIMVKMRLGGMSNRSLANLLTKSQEDLDALRRTGVGGLGTLAWKNWNKIGQFL